MEEFFLRIFRHALYLEAQYAKLVHYIGYAMRHHAQVFTTYKHVGGCFQLRQFMHCFFIPEIILAAIEIIDVKIAQLILQMRNEMLERGRLFHRYPEMEMLSL